METYIETNLLNNMYIISDMVILSIWVKRTVAPPDVLRIECKIGAQESDNTRYLTLGAIRAAFEY
jgi:hypothetical protein